MINKIFNNAFRLFRGILIKRLKKAGYSNYFAPIIFDQRFTDLFRNKGTTWKQKIWAQKRGFLSDKILNYKLNEQNYRNYLSDFDYLKLHPINKNYSHWIDDKLSTKLIFGKFENFFPKYYFHIFQGYLLRLNDLPKDLKETHLDMIKLLKEKKFLAMKMTSGSLSKGFFKLEFRDGIYFVNDKETPLSKLLTFIESVQSNNFDYIITEFIHQNNDLNKIWSNSPNILRVMVINEPNKAPEIIQGYWRFGGKEISIVGNPLAGGMISNIDIKTGFFNQGAQYVHGFLKECKYHPDSGILVEGMTPNWDFVKSKLIEICENFSELVFLGFDLIITEDGFKIIEINSHQGIKYLQYYQPLLKDENIKNFFQQRIDKKTNSLKTLYIQN